MLLVDLDLRKPMVAKYLGLGAQGGVLSVLEGRTPLASAVLQASIGPSSFLVLPGSVSAPNSSEWMASQTMGTLLQTIKRDYRSRIVIFDLPPMLLGDDVISILPRMDAALLVAGVGSTSVSDIKECQKHLQRTPVVRVVVNKATESAGQLLRLLLIEFSRTVCRQEAGNFRCRHEVFGDIVVSGFAGIGPGSGLRDLPAHDPKQAFALRIEHA